jgi:hypothetical protein
MLFAVLWAILLPLASLIVPKITPRDIPLSIATLDRHLPWTLDASAVASWFAAFAGPNIRGLVSCLPSRSSFVLLLLPIQKGNVSGRH